jgi:aminopeptidase N
MNRNSQIRALIVAAIAILAPLAPAQAPRPDFNRPRTIDVRHYTIRTSFDRAAKRVFGDTTVEFTPLGNDLRGLELDAVGLAFESVTLEPDGAPLDFSVSASSVAVRLDRGYRKGESTAVRFRYTAKPVKGIYFVEGMSLGRGIRSAPQIWTHGEPEEARHWFPAYDFPDDKATTEQFITAGTGETVIANGELVGTVDLPDGSRTHHFRMNVPHSVYLVSFVVGKYTVIEDAHGSVPLRFFTYPGKEDAARRAFGKTPAMMRIFEDLTGIAYPFAKYDQTIVSEFNFGGMENIAATTYSDVDIFLVDQTWGRPIVEDLVAHEIAHSWFGNLVTCRNWAELWLNESFATYMEAAYRERAYGREDYLKQIRKDAEEYFAENARLRKKRGLFNQLAKPDNSIFDAITYQKGSAVLHTLREAIGDEPFWKGVRIYLARHKWGNVETEDLKRAFEEASRRDLDRFFEQWVYGARHPILRYDRRYDPRNGVLIIDVEQVQTIDEASPAPFRFAVEVAIPVGDEKRFEVLRINRARQSFTIRVPSKPGKPEFDPKLRLPLLQIREK